MNIQSREGFWSISGMLILMSIILISFYEAYKIKQSDHVDLVQITLKARLENASEVKIAGSFNNWQARCCLQKSAVDNEWSIQLSLRPGVYEYMLIVDGEYRTPVDGTGRVKDGLGGSNGVFYVNKTVVKQGGGNV